MRIRPTLAACGWLLTPGCDEPAPSGPETSSSGVVAETAEDSASEPEGSVSLVDLAAFEKTPAADDPFDDRPSDIECEFGFGLEDGFFELESDLCHYGGFTQPSLAPIRVGDTVDFLLLHENLVSDKPGAQAHVAVALGDDIVYEARIDIPAEANFLDAQWVSNVDAPEGTAVHLHVHNHGINSYRLAELAVTYEN